LYTSFTDFDGKETRKGHSSQTSIRVILQNFASIEASIKMKGVCSALRVVEEHLTMKFIVTACTARLELRKGELLRVV
jgi:hypothetical protein